MDVDDAVAPPFMEELLEEGSLDFSKTDRTEDDPMDVNRENKETMIDIAPIGAMQTGSLENSEPSVSNLDTPYATNDESSTSSDDVPLAQIARSAERLNDDQIRVSATEASSVDNTDGVQDSTHSVMGVLSHSPATNSQVHSTSSSSSNTQQPSAEKPLTAFAYFFNDRQRSIRSANPMATFEQVSNIVQAMWKNLDFTTRQEYFNREQGLAGSTVSTAKKVAQDENFDGENEEDTPFVITPDPKRPGVYNVALDPTSEAKLLKDGSDGETASASTIQPRIKTTAGRGRGRGRPLGSTNKAKKEAIEKAATVKASTEKKPTAKKTTTRGRGRGRGRSRRVVSSERVESPDPSPSPSPPPVVMCLCGGCDKVPVINKKWGEDFCSSQCLVTYCSDEFKKWVETI